ncbi:calumenin isoform X1 [Halyomorpha halys]|uniref:calumenin isoform X1 n=2 Tax=Halyomorpha halys TaxID=286706 RepID=UPI0006D526B3|nr:calumenin isoform X1 [Halyomorpha halys]
MGLYPKMMHCSKVFAIVELLLFLNTNILAEKEEDIKNVTPEPHYKQGVHNPEYDHEAFLGEEAKSFNQLSPQESQKRLRLIVKKIDSDKDGFITHIELKDWIRYTQQKYMRDNVDRTWKMHNPENKENITWKDYSEQVYGFMKDMDPKELLKDQEGMTYKTLYERDRRRWINADTNGDDLLAKDEFLAFLHPEEIPKMKDLVVLEALEDIDKDKDGKISLAEYIGDMYTSENNEDKPQWVEDEIEHFTKQRDKDGDGFLDENEVKDWIVPQGFDHADAEARHLIFEADQNQDQQLTEEEIIEKYDVFVGSQATDFGEVLLRHDEF